MYVYLRSELNLWTVGFYKPDGEWEPESDHSTEESAVKRIHYLNGGSGESNFVYRSTHDLIRSDLCLLLQEHKREAITPEEMNAWLEVMYKKLNLELEK